MSSISVTEALISLRVSPLTLPLLWTEKTSLLNKQHKRTAQKHTHTHTSTRMTMSFGDDAPWMYLRKTATQVWVSTCPRPRPQTDQSEPANCFNRCLDDYGFKKNSEFYLTVWHDFMSPNEYHHHVKCIIQLFLWRNPKMWIIYTTFTILWAHFTGKSSFSSKTSLQLGYMTKFCKKSLA